MNPNAVERDFDGIAVMGHEGRLWTLLGAAPVSKRPEEIWLASQQLQNLLAFMRRARSGTLR